MNIAQAILFFNELKVSIKKKELHARTHTQKTFKVKTNSTFETLSTFSHSIICYETC